MNKVLCARCGKRVSKYAVDIHKTSRRRRFFICDDCDLKRMIEIYKAIIPALETMEFTASLMKYAQGHVFNIYGIPPKILRPNEATS